MVISSFINKRRFTFVEYVAAVAVCLGLVLFGLADFTVSPTFRSASHVISLRWMARFDSSSACVAIATFHNSLHITAHDSFIGLLLLVLSIVCDSILPNVQEKLFAAGSSRLVRAQTTPFLFPASPLARAYKHTFSLPLSHTQEVTFWSNIFTLGAMTCSMLLSGDLSGAVRYAMGNHQVFYMSRTIDCPYLPAQIVDRRTDAHPFIYRRQCTC